MNCPGSVRACYDLPDTTSPAAAEGTDAHELAAHCLRNGEVSAEQYAGCNFEGVTGKASVSGLTDIPAEMARHLGTYIRAVWDAFTDGSKSKEDFAELYVEERIDLSFVRPGMYGTGDASVFIPWKRHLHGFDLKYGFGIVEADDNEQLQYYALGLLLRFSDREIDTVSLTIVQPRAAHAEGPVRTVTYSAMDLLDFMGELTRAAEATTKPDAPRIPGAWCKFCKAAPAHCAEYRQEAVKAATDGFGDIVDPTTFDAAELGRRLAQAELLADYLKKLKAHAESEARNGRMPLGFKWIAGRGSRVWLADADKTLAQIEAATGLDLAERICPSVAQAEKTLGKDLFGRVAFLADKKPGKPKLAKESDKAKAITLAEVNAWKTDGFDEIEA